MTPDPTIQLLLDKMMTQQASGEEYQQVIDWINTKASDEKTEWLHEYITGRSANDMPVAEMPSDQWEQVIDRITSVDKAATPLTEAPAVHRVHFLRTAWFKYAAAILIIIGAGAYLYITYQNEKPSVTQVNPLPVKNDVEPGSNRASLTLSDGTKINLDSVRNGAIAQQEGATIVKNADGKIGYEARGEKGVSVAYNTMTTPRGGQYQLTLPDGSQVWLNAESSITYPTAFTGKVRQVSITGEAYFEVAKDKTKKFIVDVDGKEEVEVLGTHFNINAYRDENVMATTLLEGAVRLSANARTSNPPEKTAVLTLKPGQQGQLKDQRLSLAANPDINQVMAWKNGIFDFQGMELEAALRQIARWYDVEIVYTSGIPKKTLGGGLGRDLKLSQVLKMLEGVDIKTRIDNKKLYISQ